MLYILVIDVCNQMLTMFSRGSKPIEGAGAADTVTRKSLDFDIKNSLATKT